MKLGFKVNKFTEPPHPSSILLEGDLVTLAPLQSSKFGEELFEANSLDKKGVNWTYLSYGPFDSIDDYCNWIKPFEISNDPCFFAIVSHELNKAIGVASYLRIKPADGSIEVGHINYSPLLQSTTEATEAMYLMMKWVFDNGYRRYEWKCNALNLKSRRAAQRLGFSLEGVFRQATISKGRNRDTAWFSVIDKEWGDIQGCFKKFLSSENFDTKGTSKISLSSLTRPFLYKIDTMSDC